MKILCVDDDPNVLAAYQRNFRKRFSIETASGGVQALSLMAANGPYAVVVADMQMPGMNGVEFLRKARQAAPDTVRFMLTGNADQKTAVEAINNGQVFQFLNKPCAPDALAEALQTGLKQYQMIRAERDLLENTLNGSIKLLMEVLASAENSVFGRSQMLRNYMRQFAQSLNISQTWDLELAAMLSRIGCVTLPGEVLKKIQQHFTLTGPEKDLVTRIPEIGAKLISNIPRLEPVSKIVLYQNKNYDGSGFPFDGVAGDDIPAGARILKVLSDLVELEARGLAKFKALEQMQERAGAYDPRVLDTAFVCFDIYLQTSTSEKGAGRAVTFKELQVEHVLLSNVETNDGILILAAGTRITPLLLEKMRNFHELNSVKEPIRIEA